MDAAAYSDECSGIYHPNLSAWVGVLETFPGRVIVGVIEKRADDRAIADEMIVDVTVINPI